MFLAITHPVKHHEPSIFGMPPVTHALVPRESLAGRGRPLPGVGAAADQPLDDVQISRSSAATGRSTAWRGWGSTGGTAGTPELGSSAVALMEFSMVNQGSSRIDQG